MKPANRPAFVYVLRCSDGSLYTGWTVELARRLREHQRGTASRYTRSRRPVQLLAFWQAGDDREARSAEALFKRLSRDAKDDILSGRKAFGLPVRNAPFLPEPPLGAHMPSYTFPSEDELQSLLERAGAANVRLSTPHGDIVFSFYPEDAPQHCAAFIKLVDAGFYNGLTFHRVEPGFVVQGGDPSGDGTGGPGYSIPAEFNNRPHVRGTVAMARSSNPNSAGSQFYICLGDARFLDKQYTVFGQTIEGFEALDKIRVGDVMTFAKLEPKAGSPH